MQAGMTIHAFGPFVLDSRERRLTRDGCLVAVPGKAWQILVLLTEAGGRLVPHETLRAKLWPNVVVEDRTLTVHVSTLRKILGADRSPECIETVTGAGYRIAVPVQTLSAADAESPAMAETARPLSVQPFSTEGDVAEVDSYLGVGMADALTTALGGVRQLTVYPMAAEPAVAAEPALGHVLEGSVRLQDDRLHVSAQLIDIASGRTQWSQRFEQPQTDAAAVQEAIAQRVAGSLAQLSAADRSGLQAYRPRSTEAYFLQMQARANLKAYVRLPMMKAMGLFEQAVALDPDYAAAHAGLAWTYLLLGSTTLGRSLWPDEAMPLARKSAERAIALDPRLAEAWAVLGRGR